MTAYAARVVIRDSQKVFFIDVDAASADDAASEARELATAQGFIVEGAWASPKEA